MDGEGSNSDTMTLYSEKYAVIIVLFQPVCFVSRCIHEYVGSVGVLFSMEVFMLLYFLSFFIYFLVTAYKKMVGNKYSH